LRPVSNEEAHRLAREKGVARPLYAVVRAIVAPLFRIWFRMHVSGAEHIPRSGPAIVAPNHKSFWDSFFIAVCTRRHVRFTAKTELIQARYGKLLVRLGAFPVRPQRRSKWPSVGCRRLGLTVRPKLRHPRPARGLG